MADRPDVHPNLLLRTERKRRDWSLDKVARQFVAAAQAHKLSCAPSEHAARRAYSRLEQGWTQDPGPEYQQLVSLVFGKPSEYFFGLDAGQAGGSARTFRATSHKFAQVFAATEIARVIDHFKLHYDQVNARHEGPIQYGDTTAHMYAYPFGTVVFHIQEPIEFRSLAELALWRRDTYRKCFVWANNAVTSAGVHLDDVTKNNTYVLSVYWLDAPPWAGEELDTAVRVLSMPRILTDQDGGQPDEELGRARLAEKSILSEGLRRDDLCDFGCPSTSMGYASWSGVAYHPLSESRALSPRDIAEVELSVQSIWAYCSHLNTMVQQGLDPRPEPHHDWRYLRAVRSKLSMAAPREIGQTQTMRVAIVKSSLVLDQLDQAIAALRDAA